MAGSIRSLLGLVALAALALLGACGSEAVCPAGSTGSPCVLVTDPGPQPELPTAPATPRDDTGPGGPADVGRADDLQTANDTTDTQREEPEDAGPNGTPDAAATPEAHRAHLCSGTERWMDRAAAPSSDDTSPPWPARPLVARQVPSGAPPGGTRAPRVAPRA